MPSRFQLQFSPSTPQRTAHMDISTSGHGPRIGSKRRPAALRKATRRVKPWQRMRCQEGVRSRAETTVVEIVAPYQDWPGIPARRVESVRRLGLKGSTTHSKTNLVQCGSRGSVWIKLAASQRICSSRAVVEDAAAKTVRKLTMHRQDGKCEQ